MRRNPQSSRRKKGAGEAPTDASQHEHADAYHNSHRPCCRLLADIAVEILPASLADQQHESSSSSSSVQSSSSFLAKALRQHLLLQQQQQQAAAALTTNNNSSKKKRKKKKKKKAVAASSEESSSSAGVTTTVATTVAAGVGGEKDPESVPPTTTIATTTKNSNQQQQLEEEDDDPAAAAGVDVSAQPSPPHSSALDSYLERILQTQSQSQLTTDPAVPSVSAPAPAAENPMPTFCQFLQLRSVSSSSSSATTHVPFQVPQANVQRAVGVIHCRSCRDAVENILMVESVVPLLLPQQNTGARSHVAASLSHDNDEHAFDYVAMEEGMGPTTTTTTASTTTPTLVFVLVSDPEGQTAGWQFRQSNGEPVPWTMDVVDRLVKEYVLLLGLHPDQIMGAVPISEHHDNNNNNKNENNNNNKNDTYLPSNVVTSIQESVDSCYQNLMQDFTLLTSELEGSVVRFCETRDHDFCNIEMTSFPVMKSMDETCDELMGRVLRIVLQVTRSFHFVLIYGGRTVGGAGDAEETARHAWAFNGIMDLWTIYMTAVDEINAGIIDYEEKLFELATRGVITQMFLSSTSRSLYRKLVEVKIRVVMKTIRAARVRMDRLEYLNCVGGEDWTAPFSRKLFAHEAFFKVVANTGQKQNRKKHISKLQMDLACEDVLYTVREWIETVHQGSVSKIMEIHEHRREKLLRLRRISDIILTGVVEGAKDGDDGCYKALSYYLCEQVSVDDDDDGEASLRTLRMEIGARTLKTIHLWLASRMYSNPDGYKSERQVDMPYRLHGWVASRLGFRHGDVDVDDDFCSRSGGNTRAVCILVGLLYRWMSDRCQEWQAEVAEQELFAVEDDNNKTAETQVAGKSTKPSKKNKKKKDKKDRPVGSQDPVNGGDMKENLVDAIESKSIPPESRDGENKSSLETHRNNGAASQLPETLAEATGLRVPEPSPDTNDGRQEIAAPEHGLISAPAASAASSESEILELSEKGVGDTKSSVGGVSSVAGENEKAVKTLTAKKQPTAVDNVDPTGTAKSYVDKKAKSSINGRKEKMKKEKPGDPLMQSEETQTMVTQGIDANIRVGVYHKSTFESAEDFLVGRLLAITNTR